MNNDRPKPDKPLGHRAYGSIPHLPGSRRGPADKGLSELQARILTDKSRDRHDIITVQEKLDGSCVSVAKLNGNILALIRAGYPASGSNYPQHHAFAVWVEQNLERFNTLLAEGERVCGEWLMEAHGTIYELPHEPFVAFDIMRGHDRHLAAIVASRCDEVQIITPRVIHVGPPISIDQVLTMLEPSGHGAQDGVEGAVWRVERKGVVDFLGKYVKPSKVDGKYLESVSGKPPIYNWLPPCPLCGAPCDNCRNEEGEGYLGCSNVDCSARKFAMTDEQWKKFATSPSPPHSSDTHPDQPDG